MHASWEISREFGLQRLEQMEQRYQWAQDQLANATASYETLREQPAATERQLRHALQEIRRAQHQLQCLRNEIEQLEDVADAESMD